jgi:prepilin-type processing-associated H-X9-DG protein
MRLDDVLKQKGQDAHGIVPDDSMTPEPQDFPAQPVWAEQDADPTGQAGVTHSIAEAVQIQERQAMGNAIPNELPTSAALETSGDTVEASGSFSTAETIAQGETSLDSTMNSENSARLGESGTTIGSGRANKDESLSSAPLPFGKQRWHTTAPAPLKRHLWSEMPPLNQFFAAVGGVCLLIALGRTAGPSLAEGARQAVFPYTADGKQELCVTQLRRVAQALQVYGQDHEGRFPPLDYQNGRQQRVTWVSLLKGHTGEKDWTCPEGTGLSAEQARLISSYAMNPVLSTARPEDTDDAASSLLLADGGDRHDVSLLPPFPTWPSFGASAQHGIGNNGFDATSSNLGFLHSGQAAVVYADGHAGALAPGDWLLDAAPWGGSAVLRRSQDRLKERTPQRQELIRRLQKDDVSGATSYVAAHRSLLTPMTREFMALWRLNGGESTSDSVDAMGWKLARAWQLAGDSSWTTQLDQEQTRRCEAELQRVNGGSWEEREVPGQPTLRCQAPADWQTEEEREGRYRRLFVRSKVPSVWAVLEVGERSRYVTPQPLNWSGSEAELKRRYGKGGYRRLRFTEGTLSGNVANIWEYEVQKAGGPRLRKRYIGFTDGWTSYAIGCTAPAQDWKLWEELYKRLLDSVSVKTVFNE